MTDSKRTLPLRFDFHSEGIDILLRGKSIIDSEYGLRDYQFKDISEVMPFLVNYGYDPEDPIEKAEVLGNVHEAISFIRKNFLQPDNPEGLKLDVPRKLVELTEVTDLVLYACSAHPSQARDPKDASHLRNWACAVLKVVHTIAHMDKDLRTSTFAEVQKQILDGFYKNIHRDPEGALYLGENTEDPLRVNLVSFETKPKKPRESMLLKLLHKPENVAEDIFDRVGVRFVTETQLDALRVVKYLNDRRIVIPANIKPSRSRNTLIPLDELRSQLSTLKDDLTDERVEKLIDDIVHSSRSSSENPHTSEFYRAIQFTGRRLVKLRNPVFDDVRELKALTKSKGTPPEVAKILDRIDLKHIQKEARFFYPFEVQVMDRTSYAENVKGRSAHSEYRKAQIQTALRRVMRGFLDEARS